MFFTKNDDQLDFEKQTFEYRLKYSEKLNSKYPECVPVILKKRQHDKILQDIDKKKYLIPKNLDIGGVLMLIRKKMTVSDKQAIFIFAKQGKECFLVPINKTVGELYNEYKSDDNFLYLVYTTENTFG